MMISSAVPLQAHWDTSLQSPTYTRTSPDFRDYNTHLFSLSKSFMNAGTFDKASFVV
jgi:hypothetical protein